MLILYIYIYICVCVCVCVCKSHNKCWLEGKSTYWIFAYSATYFIIKITFLMRKEKSDLLFCTVTLKDHPFIVCYQGMYAFSIECGCLWMAPLWESFLCFTSVWHLWPPRCFFRGPRKWKSFDVKTPQSLTHCSLVSEIWMGVSRTSALQLWLCTNDLLFFWLSEKQLGDYRFQSLVEVQEAPHSGSVYKAQNSVLKVYGQL